MNKLQVFKHFITFFIPITTLVLFVAISLYSKELSSHKTVILKQEEISLKKQQELIGSKIQTIISDLQILASHHEFNPEVHTDNANKHEAITGEFLNFSRYKKVYDQVRLLDKSGQELIRINYNNGAPRPAETLQFKGERYYFKDTIQLTKGEFFFSPFDLNIEHGAIEKPFKPMIRIGTPIFSGQNSAVGIVLVNYLGRELIDNIDRMTLKSGGNIMLTNSEGFWLKGLHPEDEWGFMIPERKDKKFGNLFPKAWQNITAQTTGQFENSEGLFTFETIFPLIDKSPTISEPNKQANSKNLSWKLVSFISHDNLLATNTPLGKPYFYITISIIFFIGLTSGFIAFLRAKKEQADLALQEANANIKNIFNSSIPLCVSDKDHKIVMSNDLFNTLFNLAKGEMADAKCHNCCLCENCHTSNCPIEQIFNEGKETAICKTTINGLDGQKRHYIITCKPFKNSKDELVGVLASFQDITDFKHLESEYAKTRNLESLGYVAGGIAHDFNNLLTAISGYIMLAKNLIDPASKAADLLSESEKASLRAKKLTQRILTFSRGGTPIKKPAFIANFIIDAVKLSISEDQYTCHYDIPADLPKVEIDEGQILQVITSIIANAKEAMAEGGTITTTARTYHHDEYQYQPMPALSPGDYVEIIFKDTGTGISEENLPKIFDPYYSSKKLGSQKGTGLGLATAYSIIKKHGGTIHIKSVESQGASVYIYLPIAGQTDTLHAEDQNSLPTQWKILVMDDEILIREIAREIIVQMKWTGELAEEGAVAINLYKKAMEAGTPFNLVVLDLSVPEGLGGLETLRQLKQLNPNIKAIVSSGYADDPIMSSFEQYGFCAAVPKPYTPKILSTTISKILEG